MRHMPQGPERANGPATGEVVAAFLRCGYIRRCDADRRGRDGQSYKKGFEVRFVVGSPGDLRVVRRLLEEVGLRPGRPFRKHGRLVQPVYGRAVVDWFVAHLPAGRDRLALGFSPDGRRLAPRSRNVLSDSTKRLANTALQPTAGKQRRGKENMRRAGRG